jgi:hypothetical protein
VFLVVLPVAAVAAAVVVVGKKCENFHIHKHDENVIYKHGFHLGRDTYDPEKSSQRARFLIVVIFN